MTTLLCIKGYGALGSDVGLRLDTETGGNSLSTGKGLASSGSGRENTWTLLAALKITRHRM